VCWDEEREAIAAMRTVRRLVVEFEREMEALEAWCNRFEHSSSNLELGESKRCA
jgi:hypothetical protein